MDFLTSSDSKGSRLRDPSGTSRGGSPPAAACSSRASPELPRSRSPPEDHEDPGEVEVGEADLLRDWRLILRFLLNCRVLRNLHHGLHLGCDVRCRVLRQNVHLQQRRQLHQVGLVARKTSGTYQPSCQLFSMAIQRGYRSVSLFH